jgi:hypothetical protein
VLLRKPNQRNKQIMIVKETSLVVTTLGLRSERGLARIMRSDGAMFSECNPIGQQTRRSRKELWRVKERWL